MSDLEQFRKETRAWLEANCPAECRGPLESEEDRVWGGRNAVFKTPAHKVWLDRMAARGWTAPEDIVERSKRPEQASERMEIVFAVFERPKDVVSHPDLTLAEKRAILASWASDACAVEASFKLDPQYERQGVLFPGYAMGTIVVDPKKRYLYLVLGNGKVLFSAGIACVDDVEQQ